MLAKIKRLLFGLALVTALTGQATAAEQLVMPFACSAQGGKVSLAPSAPRAYQIHGRREDKRLTTCSPLDPRRCHTWFVHRFDVDCGGVRTSWQSIVAALTPILAESSRSLGDPGTADAGPYGGPAGVYAPGAGPIVNFPPGFAPNPMKVASFKRVKDAPAQIALPSKKPVLPPPSQTAASEPSQKPTAVPSSSAGKTVAANGPPSESKATNVAKAEPLQIEVVSEGGETTGSIQKSDAPSTLWRDAALAFIVMLAALLALSAALLLRRRAMETMPLVVAEFPHEPSTISSRVGTSSPGLDRAAVDPQGESRLRLWDETWLPVTMREALDVLGVDPDANRDMMKVTVTRLRRALHPDHALDEEDRRLRERRLKQINVAWDIVSGKRRSLWLSAKRRST